MIPMLDMQAQYQALKSDIDDRIQAVMTHGKFILGPEVFELEEKLADFAGVKHVISCANGTDALQMSLMALGIKKGDAVFCPTFTFVATAEAVALVGATPIMVDVDSETHNLCPQALEQQIEEIKKDSDLTARAIIAVDLFGLPANYPTIEAIANKYDLAVIEDAAQGFGGSLSGRKAGSFGDIATTSFFPAKPLGCYGDGGAVLTDNDDLAEILGSIRIHGKGQDKYDNIRLGMNSRLDTIQAAILLAKLEVFEEELKTRNDIAKQYTTAASEALKPQRIPDGYVSAWAQYSFTHPDRDYIQEQLKANDISSAIYYIKCIHQQPAYKDASSHKTYPNSEQLAETIISIPVHPYLKEAEIELICNVLSNL